MPFVPAADAANARLTRIPDDRLDGRTELHRQPLIASPASRLVLLEMPPGFATIPHRHPGAGESFYILTGSGRFTIGDEDFEVSPGDLLFAAVDEVHAIEAGEEGLRFLAGVAPNEDRLDEEVLIPPTGGATT